MCCDIYICHETLVLRYNFRPTLRCNAATGIGSDFAENSGIPTSFSPFTVGNVLNSDAVRGRIRGFTDGFRFGRRQRVQHSDVAAARAGRLGGVGSALSGARRGDRDGNGDRTRCHGGKERTDGRSPDCLGGGFPWGCRLVALAWTIGAVVSGAGAFDSGVSGCPDCS